jgi:hypothetical protein
MRRILFALALMGVLGIFAVTLGGCYTFGIDDDYDRMHWSMARYDLTGMLEDHRMIWLLDRPSRLTEHVVR